jgi:hypothetical protein
LVFQTFVVTNNSSRLMFPPASPVRKASPTSCSLVPIALGAIEVTETSLQRVARGDPRRLRIGYERAKAQHGNLPSAVAEGNAFPPVGVDHHCSRCSRTNDTHRFGAWKIATTLGFRKRPHK